MHRLVSLHSIDCYYRNVSCILMFFLISYGNGLSFFAIPLVQLIKGLVNAGAKAAQEEAQGPRDNEE